MPDEVDDYEALTSWREIDGTRHQNGSTATIVYKIPALIPHCPYFMNLQSGDIISTGTTPGVGLKPQLCLTGGEKMHLSINRPDILTRSVRVFSLAKSAGGTALGHQSSFAAVILGRVGCKLLTDWKLKILSKLLVDRKKRPLSQHISGLFRHL